MRLTLEKNDSAGNNQGETERALDDHEESKSNMKRD